MKFLPYFFLSISVLAVDQLHYFKLELDHQQSGVGVSINAKPLFPYELIRDERYLLDNRDYDTLFDGPFRQVVFLMRTLDRNRGVLMNAKEPAPMPILSFKFRLNVREESGLMIEENKYKVVISLSDQANTCTISCEEWGTKKSFKINQLTNPESYREFIEYLAIPSDKRTLTRPGGKGFLVDLFYRWPDVLVDEGDAKIFDLFPSLLLWDRGVANRVRRHVATAYTFKKDANWKSISSTHAGVFGQSIQAFTGVLEKEKEPGNREYIIALEEYLDLVPSDRRALKRLMDVYLEEEMEIEAYSLITRYQPFFATIREGLDNKEDLAANAERKRNFLLGRLNRFRRDEKAKVAITSPVNDDLVTGTTRLEFSVAVNDAEILLVDAFLGEQRIARLSSPPFSVPFSVDDLRAARTELRVVAYFENETYQADSINVKVLNVDEEERVNLVPLRASVLNVKDGDEAAKVENFSITENGQKKKIEHFRLSDAQLRVAFIIDTSASMMGDKILAAQFAVKSFLEKLQPDDRAAVYTFDDRVLKMAEFTNEYDNLSSELMSLSPKGATSLYDAMLIAHDALMGENGTKVLIVMSDGDDSASATTDIHVVNTLRYSPVMVYSVILTGGYFGNSQKAQQFLKEIARMSGSIHTKVRNPQNLPATFAKIYNDLRSFYYLDYYSEETDPRKRKIEVRYKGSGRLRYRVLR